MSEPVEPNPIDPRVVLPATPGSRIALRAQNEGSIGNLHGVKEHYASRIALIITWTFTGALAVSLVGILALLIADRHDPAVVKVLLEAGIPAFKEVCIALTSLFGPLLAFVLGYYFGEKNKAS